MRHRFDPPTQSTIYGYMNTKSLHGIFIWYFLLEAFYQERVLSQVPYELERKLIALPQQSSSSGFDSEQIFQLELVGTRLEAIPSKERTHTYYVYKILFVTT